MSHGQCLVRGMMPLELHSQKVVWEGGLGRKTVSSAHSGVRTEVTTAHASGDGGKGQRK